MKTEFFTALKVVAVFSLLLGIVYPLTITITAQLLMPHRANGSLLVRDGKVVGSKLIGQTFIDKRYFWGRPSAVEYDAASSAGSNLGPSSKKFMIQVTNRISAVRAENNVSADEPIPADMVLSSASGLDPHISVQNALLQAARVAKMRGISEEEIKKLIGDNTEANFVGAWARVNVVTLNLALDKV